MKVLIAIFLVAQSFAYAGPVCGNHANTSESMACCEKGHNDDDGAGIGDSHSESCCQNCDMGKGSAVQHYEAKLYYPIQLPNLEISILNAPVTVQLFDMQWEEQKFGSYSPPQIFLLKESFLI